MHHWLNPYQAPCLHEVVPGTIHESSQGSPTNNTMKAPKLSNESLLQYKRNERMDESSTYTSFQRLDNHGAPDPANGSVLMKGSCEHDEPCTEQSKRIWRIEKDALIVFEAIFGKLRRSRAATWAEDVVARVKVWHICNSMNASVSAPRLFG